MQAQEVFLRAAELARQLHTRAATPHAAIRWRGRR